MKDLTDFAVIARSAIDKLSGLGKAVLRVVPLENAPTLTEALGGLLRNGKPTFDKDQNMTLEANGSISKSNIHSVQDRLDGYVRVVARINGTNNEVKPTVNYPPLLTKARGFALLKGIVEGEGEKATVTGWDVLAVASLKAGCNVTDGCYVAFTFSKTNNYQSVSFSPNAFATIEDLDKINGLDGLHIAFDHASGDIKLLDGKGNVLDQANLHMDADTIIAEGEEGYKYVKTDRKQDIHAEKDFMPAGKTAQDSLPAQAYAPKHACFVVDVSASQEVQDAEKAVTAAGEDAVALALANAHLAKAKMEVAKSLVEQGYIRGIRVFGGDAHVDYEIGGGYRNAVKGIDSIPFLHNPEGGITGVEVYSPDAFVWTVGEVPDKQEHTFAYQMNVNAQALGFHVGDDIPLGTNIATLLGNMVAEGGFDAEKYMHEGTDSDYIDELVDAQRKLAKEELKAWNAQHPALVHDGVSGTRISSDGVDIRNGKIEIGNGVANEDNDSVKRYVIETDIADGDGARVDKGLQISVVDSQAQSSDGEGATYSDVQKDILTINAEDYISGAPTCLALLKCSKDASAGTVSAGLGGGRITANFTAGGAEEGGVFTLTITDNRANNGFGTDPRIVEIIPVYKSGADAQEAVPAPQEAVPAQRSISAIETATVVDNKSTLSIQCSQVIDWAQSIALGGVSQEGEPVSNGMELYLIVKVY